MMSGSSNISVMFSSQPTLEAKKGSSGSEVPLDEIQKRFFLLREDGGVGCRFCPDFLTKEQKRPLYPLRDHVHSVHYNILPYRCLDCTFKTSSYRVSFAHAQAAGHRRQIVQRSSSNPSSSSSSSSSSLLAENRDSSVKATKKKRKSNPMGDGSSGERSPWSSGDQPAGSSLADEEESVVLEDSIDEEDLEVAGAAPSDRVAPSARIKDTESVDNSYVVPSFLPTPPLTQRIEKEYFRYDIEGMLQCSKCSFKVRSASNDGPSSKKTLLEHVYAVHIENLPWTCKDCQFSTKFRSNLTRHCRKMIHAPNEKRNAPPGDKEPDTRVVAASAKRVKWTWAGTKMDGDENRSGDDERFGPMGHVDGDRGKKYPLPQITPSDRLSWSRKRKSHQVAKSENEDQFLLPPENESFTLSSPDRVLDVDDDDPKLDEILSDEDARAQRHTRLLDDGVQCNICGFLIRKTPRLADPLTAMLSHVWRHFESESRDGDSDAEFHARDAMEQSEGRKSEGVVLDGSVQGDED